MSSWVRYSVAAYVGLLISGALSRQPWAGPEPPGNHAPSVYQHSAPALDTQPPAPKPATQAKPDRSA